MHMALVCCRRRAADLRDQVRQAGAERDDASEADATDGEPAAPPGEGAEADDDAAWAQALPPALQWMCRVTRKMAPKVEHSAR